MISRRDKLLNYHWEQQRYEQHRQKVKSAKAAIDRSPPAQYPHIIQKAKKLQAERERTLNVEGENVRLLQRLGEIMRQKRMPDFWREPRPNFLNREKLFHTRPNTAIPKWSAPGTIEEERKEATNQYVKEIRCPTCRGKPERTRIVIPEERIPWQPPRSSFNKKKLKSLIDVVNSK